MKTVMRPVCYAIERETEKAVYCEVKTGDCHNVCKSIWIPKSVCEMQTYVATTDYKDNPETYGVRVVAIADWFMRKNRIF